MKIHILHRPSKFSLRESRLCWLDAIDAAQQDAYPEFQKILNLPALGLNQEEYKHAKALSLTVPPWMLIRLKEEWVKSPPSKIEMIQFLQNASEFLEDDFGKNVRKLLRDKLSSNANFPALRNLTDHREWMKAWESINFAAAKADLPVDRLYGPQQFLLLFSEAERKDLYIQYLTKYVPQAVQDKHKSVFDRATVFDATRANALDSLRGILGMNTPPATLEPIVRESLESYYGTVGSTNVPTRLRADARKAFLAAPAGVSLANLADIVTPSRFAGFIKNGLADTNNYTQKLNVERQERVDAKRKVTSNTQRRLDAITGAGKEQIDTETAHWKKTYKKMGSTEKTVLLAFALGSFAFSGRFRKVVLGLTGFYFLRRFFANDKDPMQTGITFTNDILTKIHDNSPTWLQWRKGSKLNSYEELRQRAELANSVLEVEDPKFADEMENEGVALGLLSDLPLYQLENNYLVPGDNRYSSVTGGTPGRRGRGVTTSAINGVGPSNAILNWPRGARFTKADPNKRVKGRPSTVAEPPLEPGLRPILLAQMERRGWKGNIDAYFNDPENLRSATQAVRDMFYFYAAVKKPDEVRDLVNEVEAEKKQVGSYARLSADGMAKYEQVLNRGRELIRIKADGTSLRDFLMDKEGKIQKLQNVKGIVAENPEDIFKKLKDEVQKHEYTVKVGPGLPVGKRPAGFVVERSPGDRLVTIKAGSPSFYETKIDISDFNKLTKDAIVSRWIKDAMDGFKKELAVKVPGRVATFNNMRLSGQDILYSAKPAVPAPAPADIASSPALQFLQTDPMDVVNKFDAWLALPPAARVLNRNPL